METLDKTKKTAISATWPEICRIWLATQLEMKKVLRWSRYQKSSIRPQDDLQHSYSIAILAKIFLEKIAKHLPGLDKELVITAFLLHDTGEGFLGKDECWGQKSDHCDLDEYRAFAERFSSLGPDVFQSLERAYLLQYALDNKKDFPDHAQEISKELADDNYYEALCFEAIEVWDYLLYALEHERDNPILFKDVIRNQSPRLDRLAKHLPGLKEEIWTEEIADYLKSRL